jgi:hypothetical protein
MVQLNESAPLDGFALWFDVEFTTTIYYHFLQLILGIKFQLLMVVI